MADLKSQTDIIKYQGEGLSFCCRNLWIYDSFKCLMKQTKDIYYLFIYYLLFARLHPFVSYCFWSVSRRIRRSNDTQFNTIFFVPRIGFGLDLKLQQYGLGFWTFAFLFPIDNTKAHEYMQ